MGHNEGSPETEVHSNTRLPKKEKFQINDLTLHPQKLKEQQQTRPRASKRKEIIKIRVELNDIETKKSTQRMNEFRGSLKK